MPFNQCARTSQRPRAAHAAEMLLPSFHPGGALPVVGRRWFPPRQQVHQQADKGGEREADGRTLGQQWP